MLLLFNRLVKLEKLVLLTGWSLERWGHVRRIPPRERRSCVGLTQRIWPPTLGGPYLASENEGWWGGVTRLGFIIHPQSTSYSRHMLLVRRESGKVTDFPQQREKEKERQNDNEGRRKMKRKFTSH